MLIAILTYIYEFYEYQQDRSVNAYSTRIVRSHIW